MSAGHCEVYPLHTSERSHSLVAPRQIVLAGRNCRMRRKYFIFMYSPQKKKCIKRTLQLSQHGPDSHCASALSLQVTGLQQEFGEHCVPQSHSSPSSMMPLPHEPKSAI